jgi:outer membrane immunogenic protein
VRQNEPRADTVLCAPEKVLDPAYGLEKRQAMKQLTCLTFAACASVALAITAFGGPEPLPSGKEMKQVAPAPPPECDFTWTGFYIGGNAGYGWGNGDTHFEPLPDAAAFSDLEPTRLSPDPSGFIGGGQLGYNWQANKWFVLGIETDFQGTDIEGDKTRNPIIDITGAPVNAPDSFLFAHERIQWFGSTRGRIGISPWCRTLFYATGGVAYGNVDYSANTNFGSAAARFATYPVKFSETSVGWTVGGGFEYAICHNWTVKAEYLYYDLGNESRTQNQLIGGVAQGPPFFVHYNFDTTGNIVRGGFNFKF